MLWPAPAQRLMQFACARGCWLPLLAGLLLALAACSSAALPATPDPFRSGGLGLTKAEWRQHHTPEPRTPTRGATPTLPEAETNAYDAGRYYVYFWYEGGAASPVPDDATIMWIGADLPHSTLSDSRALARTLLPADAALQKAGIPGAQGSITDIYRSVSLAGRYPALASAPNPWGTLAPGTIEVFYFDGGRRGMSMNAAVSKAPPTPHPPAGPPPTRVPIATPVPTAGPPGLPLPERTDLPAAVQTGGPPLPTPTGP